MGNCICIPDAKQQDNNQQDINQDKKQQDIKQQDKKQQDKKQQDIKPDKKQQNKKDKKESTQMANLNETKPNTRKMSNHYTINYPRHEKRKDTALYRRTRNELIHKRKLTCFICDKKNSTEEPLETHHFYCEKYAQTMIDWDKFALFAKNCYNIQTGENISANFDWNEVKQNPDIFVDSTYNMIVLCKQHHTSGNKGLHHVPFPDWILQKYPSDGFEFLT